MVDHQADSPLNQPEKLEFLLALRRYPRVFVRDLAHVVAVEPAIRYPDAQVQVRRLYDGFGPKRLMWGTDWPICLKQLNYAQAVELFRDRMDCFSAEDREWVLSGTVRAGLALRCLKWRRRIGTQDPTSIPATSSYPGKDWRYYLVILVGGYVANSVSESILPSVMRLWRQCSGRDAEDSLDETFLAHHIALGRASGSDLRPQTGCELIQTLGLNWNIKGGALAG